MSSTASIAKISFLLGRSIPRSLPGRAEAAASARGCRELIDALPSDAGDRGHHELRHPLAARDGDGLSAHIGENDADFAAIVGIDGARAVEHRDAMPKR